MDKQKILTKAERSTAQPAPQLQVRSGISAGASVESCMQDLAYWQNSYYNKCGGAVPTPYYQ
jgi:hypothetical protein